MRASNVGNLIMWEDEPKLCLWKHNPRSEGSILMLGIMNELITRIHISNRRKSLHSNLALLPTQKLFLFSLDKNASLVISQTVQLPIIP